MKYVAQSKEHTHNLIHRPTGQPLLTFSVDLEPSDNNKGIYKIKYLQNRNGNENVVSLNHHTQEETLYHNGEGVKNSFTPKLTVNRKHDVLSVEASQHRRLETPEAKCTHCGENHTASYWEFRIYQEIIYYSSKPLLSNQGNSPNRLDPKDVYAATHNVTKPSISYVQAVEIKSTSKQHNKQSE